MSAIVESAMMTKLIDLLSKEVGARLGKIKDIITLVRFSPNKFHQTTLKRGSATNTKWKDTPAIVFTNPFKRDVSIKEYSMVGDAAFLTDGMVRIKVKESFLFRSDEVGNFTDIADGAEVKIIEGRTLKRDDEIEVFLRTNAGAINLSMQISLGG